MILPTVNGEIALRRELGAARCAACGETGGGRAHVVSRTADGGEARLHFCGTCVAAALAVKLGAAHYAQTGELLDVEARGLAPSASSE